MLAGQSLWLVTAFTARRWPRFISPLNFESDAATQTTLINMNIGYSNGLKGIFEVQYSDYTTKIYFDFSLLFFTTSKNLNYSEKLTT